MMHALFLVIPTYSRQIMLERLLHTQITKALAKQPDTRGYDLVGFSVVCFRFFATETDVLKSFLRCPKKVKQKNWLRFFGRFFCSYPLRKKCLRICMETPLWMDTWTASAHSSAAAAAAAAAERCCGRRGQTQLNLLHSLQYYRQVHNPLVFHYWFSLIWRLSVTSLPKMKSELTSHDPWDCLVLVCAMCY